MEQTRTPAKPNGRVRVSSAVNKFSALPCHGEDMIPTSVQEGQDMAYPGDIVDFVVGQTNVDCVTASATLDAYHGDVGERGLM